MNIPLTQQLLNSLASHRRDSLWSHESTPPSPDYQLAIDGLNSSDYRSGLVGLYKDLISRRDFSQRLWEWLCDGKSSLDLQATSAFKRASMALSADLRAESLKLDSHIRTAKYVFEQTQMYLTRLDIKYVIDHRPSWYSSCRKFLAKFTRKYLKDLTGYSSAPVHDIHTDYLKDLGAKKRVSGYRARLMAELEHASSEGWFCVFDTLTIAPELESSFFEDKTAIRDHCRRIGRLINKMLGRPISSSYTDVFKYFIVPEYGSKTDRLHFHALYCMKVLPYGSSDPNLCKPVAKYREIRAFKVWSYGFSSPVAMRYSGDAFSLAGWAWPVVPSKKAGQFEPLSVKPALAVAFYVTKYASKNVEGLKTQCQNLKQNYRIRMSRRFGHRLPSMNHLNLKTLVQLTRLHWTTTPKAMLIRKNASLMLKSLLVGLSVKNFLDRRTPRVTLLERLRDLTQKTHDPNPQKTIPSPVPVLMLTDLSEATLAYIDTTHFRPKSARVGAFV